jgi:hypothetical protein
MPNLSYLSLARWMGQQRPWRPPSKKPDGRCEHQDNQQRRQAGRGTRRSSRGGAVRGQDSPAARIGFRNAFHPLTNYPACG